VYISNDSFNQNFTDSTGGAISTGFNTGASGLGVTINRSTFTGNKAQSSAGAVAGGALFDTNSTKLAITNSSFSGNSATSSTVGQGGAIYLNTTGASSATIADVTISGNTAATAGGGFFATGATTATLSRTNFTNNSANLGGGLDVASATVTVSQSTVAGNTAATGGGVYNTGTFNLYSGTVSGNTASNGNGGGIFSSSNAAGVELAVINSTVANNVTTQGGGGGVFTQDAQAVFTNSTIASNQAGANGGGLFEAVAGGATLNNTIVAQNTVAGAANDIGGAVVVATSKNNLIGTGGSGGLVNGLPNNNQVGVANPGLNPLGNYGGLTQTMSLQDTSAAVNNGSNALAVYPDGSPIVTDQRGKPRVFGASVDIGAVELQASLTFKLLSNGDLIQTKNDLQSTIALNVNAIAVDASNTLYEQEIDGSLWQYKNATWTMLDKNVASIKLASDGTLYDLETSGLVRSYSNGVLAANPVRTGVESIGVNGTTLYMLQSNGNFSSFNGTTVTLINPKVSSFTVAPNGVYAYQVIGGPINVSNGGTVATGTSLVGLDSDANLWFLRAGSLVEDSTSSPALPQVASIPNVVSALMTTDSANITSVDYLTISGNVVNTASGALIDTGVRNFAVANNGTVYAIEAAENLFAFNSDGKSSVLDNRAVTVQVSSSGLMYVLEDSSVLWVLSNLKGNAWTLLDTGTKSFGLTGAGVLWELEIGGRLWSQTSGTWKLMDSNSTSLFVAANGTIAELEPSGALWTFDTVAGWSLKESIAIQIAIAADSALVVLDNNQALYWSDYTIQHPMLPAGSGTTSFTLTNGNTVTAKPGNQVFII
jgi:hypothetical protein